MERRRIGFGRRAVKSMQVFLFAFSSMHRPPFGRCECTLLLRTVAKILRNVSTDVCGTIRRAAGCRLIGRSYSPSDIGLPISPTCCYTMCGTNKYIPQRKTVECTPTYYSAASYLKRDTGGPRRNNQKIHKHERDSSALSTGTIFPASKPKRKHGSPSTTVSKTIAMPDTVSHCNPISCRKS